MVLRAYKRIGERAKLGPPSVDAAPELAFRKRVNVLSKARNNSLRRGQVIRYRWGLATPVSPCLGVGMAGAVVGIDL